MRKPGDQIDFQLFDAADVRLYDIDFTVSVTKTVKSFHV